jgi:hypothetical protein
MDLPHVPLRRCVACGDRLPKRELKRIVNSSKEGFQLDVTGKLPGRGVYFCSKPRCWERGLLTGRVDYALRTQIAVPDRQRLLNLLTNAESKNQI